MPSFNQVQYIERSILSVLNQDYPNVELIIIDGGSSDGTVDIIKRYEKHIDYWLSEKDDGQSDALNKGFKRAKGEILGWLNSDDLYLPNAFTNVVEAFQRHPSKQVIFGDWLSIDENEEVIDLNHAFDFNLNHFKYEGFHLNAQSMFWRRQVHEQFSGFDVSLYNTMDYQMILEFGINEGQKGFYRVPHVLGAFRRYDGQKTGAAFSNNVMQEHFRIACHYGYADKYLAMGKLKRVVYRFRRALWYFRRSGLKGLHNRVLVSWRRKLGIGPQNLCSNK